MGLRNPSQSWHQNDIFFARIGLTGMAGEFIWFCFEKKIDGSRTAFYLAAPALTAGTGHDG